ncbi:MAG: hypothetical protein ACJAZ1_003082, partial [Yoonia sp.]
MDREPQSITVLDMVIVDECHIRAKVIEELVLAQPDVV